MEYKDKIKEIRKRLHLTQEKFGEGINVEKSFIGQLEIGLKKPGRKTIQKICTTYNIDPREFFEIERKPTIKTEDPLISLYKKIPKDKHNILLKVNESLIDMDIEGIREILKHVDKEKLWERTTRRKKSKAG